MTTTLRQIRGERIRALRQLKKISQRELGRAAGISQAHVWRIELGKSDMSLAVAERIAAALDVAVADLFREAS